LGQRYHCFGIHAPVSSLLIDSIDSLDPVSSLLIDSIDSLDHAHTLVQICLLQILTTVLVFLSARGS
jgi:hypothetical protein